MSRRALLLVVALTAGLLTACAGARPAGSLLPPLHRRCLSAARHSAPLVTEWPAAEKANLEALLRRGGVAVAYSGCEMHVLTECRAPGAYAWMRTTPANDVLEIKGADELYAKLPLGAVSLEGALARSGELKVSTYVAGQLRLEGATAADLGSGGECARATHVIGALAIGAFTLARGESHAAKASASVASVGEAGGKRTVSTGVVSAAGNIDACAAATELAPDPSCASPLQVFLWPIPGRATDEGPPGTVKVDFVAADASRRWDVYVDDEVACTTPCVRWVAPNRPLLLRTRDDGLFSGPDKLRLVGLGARAAEAPLQLQAHGTQTGKLATGITFTTFGGTAIMTGIALTALGCSRDEAGMCTAGQITLGAGALVTAGAIWLILDALPRAELRALGEP